MDILHQVVVMCTHALVCFCAHLIGLRTCHDVMVQFYGGNMTKKKMISVRVDQDIIETLKDMAGEDGSYQQLLNEALVQWCQAQTTGQGLLVDMERRLEAVNQRLEEALKAQRENTAC